MIHSNFWTFWVSWNYIILRDITLYVIYLTALFFKLSFQFHSADQIYELLYRNHINARALIGQSAVVYCASKLMEISRVFCIII